MTIGSKNRRKLYRVGITCEQIRGFTDPELNIIPFVAGGDSHVDYILGQQDQLMLEIKVSTM